MNFTLFSRLYWLYSLHQRRTLDLYPTRLLYIAWIDIYSSSIYTYGIMAQTINLAAPSETTKKTTIPPTPAELRLHIYSYALPEPNTLCFRNDGRIKLVKAKKTLDVWQTTSTKHQEPPLLQVCKLTRREMLPLYYGAQTFEFKDDITSLRAWLKEANTFVLPMLHYVRDLHISTGLSFTHYCKSGILFGSAVYDLTDDTYSLSINTRDVKCACS